MDTKECKRCKQAKPRARFSRHPRAVDGLCGTCKDCRNEDAKRYRLQKPELYRAADRRHNRTEKKRALQRERRRKRRQTSEDLRVYDRQYRKDPERLLKHKARLVLGRAVRSGKILRQQCERCSNLGDGHHDDYSKPLEVRWLCVTHHAEHHRKFN